MDIINIYRLLHPTTTEYTLSQAHMKYTPRQTTFWAIKHTLINLKHQKSCKVCSQTAVRSNWKSITKTKLENSQILED